MFYEVKEVLDIKAELGECPVWSVKEQCLYFVDILNPAIYHFDPATGALTAYRMPEHIGCFGLREQGGFIAAKRSGVYLLDQEGRMEAKIAVNPTDQTKSRFNDSGVDPWGRFWCGTMWEADDEEPNARIMVKGLTVTNGIAFSPDRQWMYYTDTARNTLYRQALDPETGEMQGGRERLKHFGDGQPDGAAFDNLGNYWSAQYGGGKVLCIAPRGETVDEIILPVPKPTMVTFGGPELKTLYITSVRENMSIEELQIYPLSGGLFAVELEVTGNAAALYKG